MKNLDTFIFTATILIMLFGFAVGIETGINEGKNLNWEEAQKIGYSIHDSETGKFRWKTLEEINKAKN